MAQLYAVSAANDEKSAEEAKGIEGGSPQGRSKLIGIW
jgi:hypothetical protein